MGTKHQRLPVSRRHQLMGLQPSWQLRYRPGSRLSWNLMSRMSWSKLPAEVSLHRQLPVRLRHASR